MNMEFKQNWEDTRKRFLKWWNFEPTDRPVCIVRYPSRGQEEGFRSIASTSYVDPEIGKKDFQGFLQRAVSNFSRIRYGGEAYPSVSVNLGPGAFGVYLGARPTFTENSVWYDECFSHIEEGNLSLTQGEEWFQFTIHSLQYAKEQSADRYLVSFPDLVEGLDTLAALYGTATILVALMDNAERIHTLQKQALDLWFQCLDRLYPVVRDEKGWSSYTIFDIWGPGTTIKLQCDISAMLSPGMFDEFVLPYLTEQCTRITSPIYHLDGPDALIHLPSLLKIPSLKCVQWTPGAGKPDAGDPCWWEKVYEPILSSGKCIHATMPVERVRPFVQHFGGRGVFVKTLVETYEEGKALCKDLGLE